MTAKVVMYSSSDTTVFQKILYTFGCNRFQRKKITILTDDGQRIHSQMVGSLSKN